MHIDKVIFGLSEQSGSRLNFRFPNLPMLEMSSLFGLFTNEPTLPGPVLCDEESHWSQSSADTNADRVHLELRGYITLRA